MVSIIMPSYNVEIYIEKAIRSLLNQVFKDFELIIINDSSTDNTQEICKKISDLYNRIVLVNKNNEGVSSTRNLGLDLAKGEYIAFNEVEEVFL